MRSFHLMLLEAETSEPRRVDFHADGPDHAFQIARNERNGLHVELWEADKLLARMTKEDGNFWKLLPNDAGNSNFPVGSAKVARPDLDTLGRLARDNART